MDVDYSVSETHENTCLDQRRVRQNNGVAYSPLNIESRSTARRGHICFSCFSKRCCCIFLVAFSMLVGSFLLVVTNLMGAFPWTPPHAIPGLSEPLCMSQNNRTRDPRNDAITLVPIHHSQINLTRRATSLPKISERTKLHGAYSGFIWNDEDANTFKWRPQGIASAPPALLGRKFLFVSWYGLTDQNYQNRGARISMVDVTDMNNASSNNTLAYQHILLLDQNNCTFPHLHAGGLVFVDGKLHVPDSRKRGYAVRVFDFVHGLLQVQSSSNNVDDSSFYGYSYVLREESSYPIPTKPSFLSYDQDRDLMVVGTYHKCGSKLKLHSDEKECQQEPENRLVWYRMPTEEKEGSDVRPTEILTCTPFFSEMQGAVSTNNNGSILLSSSSYGPFFDSHLHIVEHFGGPTACNQTSWKGIGDDFRVLKYPPGLEDLHVDKFGMHGTDIWMLTEFETRLLFAEFETRMVFVTNLDQLLLSR